MNYKELKKVFLIYSGSYAFLILSFIYLFINLEDKLIKICISVFLFFLMFVFNYFIIYIKFIIPFKNLKTSIKSGIIDTDKIKENIYNPILADINDFIMNINENICENEMKTKAIQEFLSMISHELRAPVTVIRGSMEALCDGIIDEPAVVDEYHFQILKESIYLQRLVGDLLELSRLQNSEFEMEREELNVINVLEDVIWGMKKISSEKNITFDFDKGNNIINYKGDYGRLRQMFIVVIDNAIKFSKPNSKIDVIVNTENNCHKVHIKDYGCGIKKENIPDIFNKFFKNNSEENKNGTGLGLSIANQIAIRHGIDVKVYSQEGEGAEFVFTFALEAKKIN